MKTTLYTVLCIAIRLGAVLMAVNVAGQSLYVLLQVGPGAFTAGTLLTGAFALLVAAAMWLWPGLLAWWAIGGRRHEVLESLITAEQLQYIALSVLGIWLCISNLGYCAGRIVIMLVMHHRLDDLASGQLPVSEWRHLVIDGLVALAGAALAVGARGFVGMLHRMRGYPAVEAKAANHDTGVAQGD